ncbi:MAG: hypothetical protein ACHQVS_01070 [Candidatus Babeliales bacterium]
MAKRYTTHALRMVVVASVIALSGNAYASDHGRYTKRHNLTCKQLFLMALGLTAVANGNIECVEIKGNNLDRGLFVIKDPVCAETLGGDVSKGYVHVEGYVAGRIDGIASHNTPSTVSIAPVACIIDEGFSFGKTRREATSCMRLHKLESTDIAYHGHQEPQAQLPAPAQ